VVSSLDLDLVLQEVVDAACELTSARYGALALVNPAGQFQRLLVHGLSDAQRRDMGELPHGRGILGMLHVADDPLRIAAIEEHEHHVGFPVGHPPMSSFLGIQIGDQGTVLGSLYLADKSGHEFSAGDEELLRLFALQAAAAIRNARSFQLEQERRAESEAARRSIAESEERLQARLKDIERLRTDVLAAIAHEFKTPLTAIRTAVGVLRDPALPTNASQEKRLLEAISQSSMLMQRLVTDFVDLARFQSGSIQLEPTHFDARVLAKEAALGMSALFDSRGQTLIIDAPRQPQWIKGDHRRLRQALTNLLANAQKFGPDGSAITVKISVQDGDATWTVIDSGPGIPEAAQRRLFERFFTLPEGDSGRAGGTGLGLSIAMAIAQFHGGTIEVDSEPGRGSSFILRVPANNGPEGNRA
jgi:signal transduction histidine kinase